MRLSSLLLPLLSLVSLAVAASEDFVPTPEKPFEIRISYLVKEKQSSPQDLVSLENGEVAAVEFTLKNDEDDEVTIAGVAGSFNNPVTGDVVANVTGSKIGPITVPSGETVTFIQNIGLDLNPENYLFVPAIYVFHQEKFMQLGARNQLVTVSDPKISVFNPQLIFLEIVLVASLAGIAYVIYSIFGKQYFESVTPKKSASAQPSAAVASGSKKLDESWIPQHHLRSASKKVKKTA
ncbi:unnamed protein product [Kuraishia capsulata CBS 1993]|uniref:Increased recombination centers protein 22 n=1 Tax=Kuraishia capsulata CBS 1993 TaxID=1382522 RepID=W6MJL7_9ASCO|nr:uncharacterized protein KUCA_T00002448001 [Kuraishia capsulata CBS 1993]CDK26476.1 unnamed protein product [Kuraishia capsulata CBS 1993]